MAAQDSLLCGGATPRGEAKCPLPPSPPPRRPGSQLAPSSLAPLPMGSALQGVEHAFVGVSTWGFLSDQ